MTVTPLTDAGDGRPESQLRSSAPDFSQAVTRAFDAASAALARADAAESAFTRGRGGLQEMILERARADVALSIASATTTHVAQSLQTILGMQV